jgi:Histidine kinase-, DNA gyrase B-, and HSP90-like ATPase
MSKRSCTGSQASGPKPARLPANSNMGAPPALYDAACKSLAEARSVDEIKEIRDQAIALQLSSIRVDNRDLWRAAVDIWRQARQRLTDFEQAKKQTSDARFLQIVAKREYGSRVKVKPEPKLTRVAFRVSRLMEFCSKRELQNQTGHSINEWPEVVCKELLDNSIDAAEEAEISPVISIAVTPESFTISDNGAGIKTSTIKSILDYRIRVSSREAYVSPTRGAQGNALKTILAMAYVLDRECRETQADAVGITIIETKGVCHRLTFDVDHINNQPRITHSTEPSPVTVGTKITVTWPNTKLFNQSRAEIADLCEAYVWFNPHLTLRAIFSGEEFIDVEATNPQWDKWRPRDPTSAHWYDEARLQRYLAAHVAHDRDRKRQRTVREFISEFRGLSGSAVQRKVLEEVGCSHVSLATFFGVEKVNRAGIAKLLASIQKHTKPVVPKHLGIIGESHFRARFLAAGGNAETFRYQLRKGLDDTLPYIVEFAFGLHQSGLTAGGSVSRKIMTGANWSAAITNPFRSFGATGEGLESTLAKVRANAREPVICALHLAHARIQFADRGKSSIILTDDAEQPDD